ncbi:hypothetical protein DH2020_026644 [Rehmannia glutinosa]|uniref:DUF4408 domain-containing protein n=1 Tax=Rehmannia glutinosa TaxID=99300 RepID=A0ABR0VZD3_REHGL
MSRHFDSRTKLTLEDVHIRIRFFRSFEISSYEVGECACVTKKGLLVMNGVEIVTTWLTPTVLFCLLNLMIGTIFFISSLKPNTKRINLGDNNKDEHRPQLGRVPSFFERVKSINLSRYQPEQPDQAHYAVPAEQQAAHQQEPEYEGEEPHHVARTKSDAVTKVKPAARVLKKSASEKVLAAAKKREEEEEVDKRGRRR